MIANGRAAADETQRLALSALREREAEEPSTLLVPALGNAVAVLLASGEFARAESLASRAVDLSAKYLRY